MGTTKMYKELQINFWWSIMKCEIAKFVEKCLTCQRIKVEYQIPGEMLQLIEIPEWKWDNITMDFVVELPHTRKGYGVVWILVDRLMKSSYFIPFKMMIKVIAMEDLYIQEIVHLHGIPKSIISDRVLKFTLRSWK